MENKKELFEQYQENNYFEIYDGLRGSFDQFDLEKIVKENKFQHLYFNGENFIDVDKVIYFESVEDKFNYIDELFSDNEYVKIVLKDDKEIDFMFSDKEKTMKYEGFTLHLEENSKIEEIDIEDIKSLEPRETMIYSYCGFFSKKFNFEKEVIYEGETYNFVSNLKGVCDFIKNCNNDNLNKFLEKVSKYDIL